MYAYNNIMCNYCVRITHNHACVMMNDEWLHVNFLCSPFPFLKVVYIRHINVYYAKCRHHRFCHKTQIHRKSCTFCTTFTIAVIIVFGFCTFASVTLKNIAKFFVGLCWKIYNERLHHVTCNILYALCFVYCVPINFKMACIVLSIKIRYTVTV